MTRTARSTRQWPVLVTGLFALLIWGSRAVQALLMDGEPSARALFACFALVVTGFLTGVTAWMLGAPKRAKRPPAEKVAARDMKSMFLLLALMSIGLGSSPIVDASTGSWEWAGMIALSVVGGMHLGIFLMVSTDQDGALDAHRPTAGAPAND